MAIQGHILFNPTLQPLLLNRSDMMASCTHPNVKDPQTNILTGLSLEELEAIRDFHTEDVALYERALALRARRMP